MSGTNISVAAGRTPTQLTGAPFKHGATVYNNDSSLSVWISDTPSTAIGNGYQIGPLGSVFWESERAPWAIVGNDLAGVLGTTSVLLTVSDNIKEPVNPVSNAIAIANAGIQTINVSTPVWRQVGGSPITIPPGQGSPALITAAYSSLIFNLGASPQSCGLILFHYDTTSLNNVIAVQNLGSTRMASFSYRTPLYGGALILFNSSHSISSVSVSGALSTRATQSPQYISALAAVSAGSAIIDRSDGPLPGTSTFGDAFVTNGGPASMRIFARAVAAGNMYLGLENLLWNQSGPSDTIQVQYPWGPFPMTGGTDEFWYPNIYIPPGIWRLAQLSPGLNTIDIQIALAGAN